MNIAAKRSQLEPGSNDGPWLSQQAFTVLGGSCAGVSEFWIGLIFYRTRPDIHPSSGWDRVRDCPYGWLASTPSAARIAGVSNLSGARIRLELKAR